MILLVFEYLSTSELLEIVPYVCKSWLKSAKSNELWSVLLSISYPNQHWTGKTNLKSLFLRKKSEEMKKITIIEGRKLHVYSVPMLSHREWELPSEFRPVEYAKWTLVGTRVLFTGGYIRSTGKYVDSVYDISAGQGSVRVLQSLQEVRGSHGLVYYQGRVYCLGGFNGQFLRAAEKYVVDKDCWKRVGEMTYARSHFTPTIVKDCLYAAGGRTKVIEAMSLRTERFESLPLSLLYTEASVVLAHTEDSLIALQKSTLSVWKLFPRRAFKPEIYKSPSKVWESRMQPVTIQGDIWLLEDLSNSIYRLQPGKWQVTEALFRPNCYTFVLGVKPVTAARRR